MLLFNTHIDCLARIISEKLFDCVQDITEIAFLKDNAMMNCKNICNMTTSDVKDSNT